MYAINLPKVLILLMLLLTFISCGGGGGGGTGDIEERKADVSVMGSFPLEILRADIQIDSISKVYSIRVDGQIKTANVVDGAFSIDLERDASYILAFVDTNEAVVGFLSLENGIDSLPLLAIDDSINSIDLKQLNLDGNSIIPTHNPLGDEIGLSADELEFIAKNDDLFVESLKNFDANNDGRADFIDQNSFRIFLIGWIKMGAFYNQLTPTLRPNPMENGWGYSVSLAARAENLPNLVNFILPDGSTYFSQEDVNIYAANDKVFFSTGIEEEMPQSGDYTITYNSEVLTFKGLNPSSFFNTVLIPVPTAELNNNGTLHKVSWRYYDETGKEYITPPYNAFKEINLGISKADGFSYIGVYNHYHEALSSTEHILQDQTLTWSSLDRIDLTLSDYFGNTMVFIYSKDVIWTPTSSGS